MVTVKYIDAETRKSIKASTVKTGEVGIKYTTTSPTISGYKLVASTSNKNGTFRDGNILVTYYYIKDGTVETKPTISSFTTDKASPQAKGSKVTLIAKATGEGTLQYRFRVGTANGNSSLIKDYSTSSTATWNANYVGTKILYVDVKDSNGQVVTKTINYVVSDKIVAPTISSFTTNKISPQVKGTQVTLTAKATGEGTLQYRFRVGTANGNSSLIKDYSTSNTAIWNANYVGTKILYVDVRDANGRVTTKTINYVIK